MLGDSVGELQHPLLAALDELGDAERFDVALALETELLFDLDLDPEPLAVVPILEALVFAEHGVVALEEVLVGPTPGVVDAHRVVGRDGAVEEGVAPLRPSVAAKILLANPVALPLGEGLALQCGEVDLGGHFGESRIWHGASLLSLSETSNNQKARPRC